MLSQEEFTDMRASNKVLRDKVEIWLAADDKVKSLMAQK